MPTTEKRTVVPALCRSCAAAVAAGEPFCAACGKVQPPQPIDYFALFRLPRKLQIDTANLESRFYRLSRKLHPDLYARAPEEEQQWSLAQSSLLNDAYRALKDPVERTRYLLRLEGVQFEDDRPVNGGSANSSKPSNPSGAPADLLEEVFELNLQLEELRANQKLGQDDPGLRHDLEQAKEQFTAQLDRLDNELHSLWSVWDDAIEREDGSGKTGAKENLAALLQRRNYLRNLVRDVNETLGES